MLPSSSMQDMRRWIVTTLLNSERTFVMTLSSLLQVGCAVVIPVIALFCVSAAVA